MTSYRPAAMAGMFYSDNPIQLSRNINEFLAHTNQAQAPATKTLQALIAPHAGYIYSGPIAASAYSLLHSKKHLDIILLGPSHRVAFKGMAIPSVDAFSTPLGLVNINTVLADYCLQQKAVIRNDLAHHQEHSLEVQLPFLQTVLSSFSIVPILVSDCAAEDICHLLQKLSTKNVFIIVSSDLSHYHDYETAQSLDKLTSQNIEQLNEQEITYEHACGKTPVQGLIQYAKKNLLSAETLDLRNSGDTAGDRSRVVGYGAYAFYS